MISEQTIDTCIETLTNEDQDWMKSMAEAQPVVAGFLAAEDLDAFTRNEVQYLYYLAVLCWMCFDETYPEMVEIEEDYISLKEEQNWNRIDSLRPGSLKIIVDRWIPDYPEPEILYYLEDALMLDDEDPEHPVTKAGQIPLFATLLTLVDALIHASKLP